MLLLLVVLLRPEATIGGHALAVLVGIVAALFAIVFTVETTGRERRSTDASRAAGCWALAAMSGISWFAAGAVRDHAYASAFHDAVAALEPLAAAIEHYEAQHGTPPPDLEALVPRWIAQVPAVPRAFGAPSYVNCASWSSVGCGQRWGLSVRLSTGGWSVLDVTCGPRSQADPAPRSGRWSLHVDD